MVFLLNLVFVYGVKYFKNLINNFSQVVAAEIYYSKILPNDTRKMIGNYIKKYRKLARHLIKSHNRSYMLYQIEEVIRYLHHSTPAEDKKDKQI